MAISKRMRFEILKRDGHRCRYCGKTAAEAVITVDHVVPQALGGSDDPSNLVAACKGCNDGKASSSPDAPLVADVAGDALRWATAMQAAAGEMLAKASGDVDASAHFEKAWARYGTGPRRKPLPKDPGWEHTVQTLLSAGLPMGVLEECIEIAMSQRRVAEDNVFRYMCGVAWRKVRELQDRAEEIAQDAPSGSTASGTDVWDAVDMGRLSVARELLSQLPDDVQAYYMDQADMSEYQEEGEPPQTETQQTCEAISCAVNALLHDVHYLRERAEAAIRAHPENIGDLCFKEVHERFNCGPLSNPVFRVTDALYAFEDLVHLSAAQAYLGALSPEEQAEWVEFARALNSSGWPISDERMLVRAAACARTYRDENKHYPVMCLARGKHIEACPQRSTFTAWVNEWPCCGEGTCTGHGFCGQHLEVMVNGDHVNRHGKTLTIRDYTALPAESEKVPF